MTINQMLENCRTSAVEITYKFYVDICDGDNVKEHMEIDKITGAYYRDLERFTMDNIYKLIRNIRKTNLMSDEEKQKAINFIKKCPEFVKTEESVSNILVGHFRRFADVYKTM